MRGAGILASLLAILLFLAVRASMPALVADPARGLSSLVMMNFADNGEALIHSLPGASAAHMPMADIMAAELSNHRGLSWRQCRMLSGFFLAVLSVSAAMMLKPGAPFYPAVCLIVILAAESQTVSKYMQHFYSPMVMLVACLLIRQSGNGGRWPAALGLGSGLLFRSPLAFLPPLLASREIWQSRGRRGAWKKSMIWLVPFLFLLPWAAANHAVHKQWIFFEANATSPNIVGGALGLIGSTKGDWKSLIDSAAVDSNSTWSVLYWAAIEALSHPWRSARALALRLRLVAGFHPLLLLAAAAGLWLNRGNPRMLKVALLAGYFILVHCLMSVQENYFTPLWPLLVLPACSLMAGRDREEEATPWLRAAHGAVSACLAVALAWSLYTFVVLYRYANSKGLSTQAGLLSALDKHPNDSWLLAGRGRMRWLQGDWSGALEDLRGAYGLAPGNPQRSLEIAWAEMLGGDFRSLRAWTFKSNHPAESESFVEIDSMILKAFALLRQGSSSDARRALAVMDEYYKSRAAVRGDAVSAAGPALERLRSASAGVLAQRMTRLVRDYLPLAERPAFCLALTKIFPLHEHLRKAEFLGLLGVDYAMIAASREDYRRMLPLLQDLTSLYPRETMLWVELAATAVHAGRRDLALAALRSAETLGPTAPELMQIAFAYGRLRERRRAGEILERLISGGARDPVLWIAQARLLLQGGQRELALKLMTAAAGLTMKDEQRHELTLLYDESGQGKTALAMFKALVEKHPANGLYRKDLGVCAFRLGDKEEARRSLEAALELDPGLQDARLSLGAVHMARREPREALKVYDSALSAAGSGGPLERALQDARAQALRELK